MDGLDIKPILESILFVSESPVRLETLVEILRETTREEILEGIQRIQTECEDPSRGVELFQIADGYQFRTKPQWAEWMSRLKKKKPVKLSQSALETLAIIAYRQPIIRPEIDNIRGVDSGWILRSLLEKGLVKIMGRKDLPGRPIIYGTTKVFLELFSLNALGDLPSLSEIQAPMDAVNPQPGEISGYAAAVDEKTDLGEPVEAEGSEGSGIQPPIEPATSEAKEAALFKDVASEQADDLPPRLLPLHPLSQSDTGSGNENDGREES